MPRTSEILNNVSREIPLIVPTPSTCAMKLTLRPTFSAKDSYGMLLCMGVFLHIALQVVLNILVVTNTMPNTGVSLPFISYGGSSVSFLMAEMGLVLRVARENEV